MNCDIEDIQECPADSTLAGKVAVCDGCPGKDLCLSQVSQPDPDQQVIDVRLKAIRHKILVLSGKGGVVGLEVSFVWQQAPLNTRIELGPIEEEAAAVVWSLKKARLFLLGCPNLLLVTDHRLLVKLFCDRELKHIENPRLLRLKKSLHYKFSVKYVVGERNTAADTLSRYPGLKASPNEIDMEDVEEVCRIMCAAMIASFRDVDSDIIIDSEDVEKIASKDDDYQLLLKRVRNNNWPESRNMVEPALKSYFQVRERLSHINGLVTYAFDEGHIRLVVPQALRVYSMPMLFR
ncbi:uncharacterized protein [Palaemon carinicauda]|uniref:uncharacterized protein isoform X2 n=1 Tax=Palaemon carinicauda TaxID=392227 RepID=UPI0035B5F7FA